MTPAVLGVAEVADLLGVKKPNVRKLLDRYGVAPLETLALGPVYSRDSIEQLRRRREADEAGRAADEKRRAAARARAA